MINAAIGFESKNFMQNKSEKRAGDPAAMRSNLCSAPRQKSNREKGSN